MSAGPCYISVVPTTRATPRSSLRVSRFLRITLHSLLITLSLLSLALKKCPQCAKEYADTENYCAMCEDAEGKPVRLKPVEKPKPKPAPPKTESPAPTPQPQPKMVARVKNQQGSDEFLWLKDSSVMIRIPAGEFWMGSPEGEGDNDERPQHKVYLSDYYIDKHEVTNEQFERFVRAAGHQTDAERLGSGRVYDKDSSKWIDRKGVSWRTYYSYATRNHPVILVSWNDAKAYCDWAGKRLPTEAEWEKAARGTDARQCPWGNSAPGSSRNGNFADEAAKREFPNWMIVSGYDDGYVRTAPVGTYPAGASPYGCLDMAGNVWEWCSDWYGETYYGTSPSNNPQGPSSGSSRVLRGGSWYNCAGLLRCAYRCGVGASSRDDGDGFRCSYRQ